MNQQYMRRIVIVVCSVAILAAPLVWGAWHVWRQYTWVQENLARIEPRHARMLGLQSQASELAQTLQRATALRHQFAYPATQDSTQTGNLAQQKVRDIFGAAGLQVISSQALPAKEEGSFDSIALSVRAEGDILALQSTLAVLGSQQPAIYLDELTVQLVGGLAQANHRVAPKLAIQFSLSVLRDRS